MIERLLWYAPVQILLEPPAEEKAAIQSAEKDIQYAREKTTPAAVFHLYM